MRFTLLIPLLAACGSVNPDITPDAPAADDAAVEDDAAIVPEDTTPPCTDPAVCLYLPQTYPIELVTSSFVDDTRVGGTRTIPIAIRFARTAPQPMPVLILSHGGASGQNDPTSALEDWAIAAAQVGYFTIAIAHVPRTQPQREALCVSLGFTAAECPTFKFLSYDRPLDIARTIDRTVALASTPEFMGKLDATRIGVLGHSAGAGGALMVAGTPREMNGQRVLSDPRPMAFVALSPQAPGSDGLDAAGYGMVTRPTLIGTGRGDENPPDTADGRASVYDLVQPGNKARLFIEDPAAVHMLFGGEVSACTDTGATLDHCKDLANWLRSAVLSFLDAQLKASPEAQAFMASTNLGEVSAGVAEWATR